MTGDLNMNSHRITGVTSPSANTDASNKKYVNDRVDYGINQARIKDVFVKYHETQAEYQMTFTMPIDFSSMMIKIEPLKAMFTLDNTVTFEYVGLISDIQSRFRSNMSGMNYIGIKGSFKFPVNSIGEDMNIFGIIESNNDTITIKFYGDITDIGSINTPIFCTAAICPVSNI